MIAWPNDQGTAVMCAMDCHEAHAEGEDLRALLRIRLQNRRLLNYRECAIAGLGCEPRTDRQFTAGALKFGRSGSARSFEGEHGDWTHAGAQERLI
jgi:hypothetical protein